MRNKRCKKVFAVVLTSIMLLINAATVMAEELDETVSGQEIVENGDVEQESVDGNVELKAEDGFGLEKYDINYNSEYYIYNRALDLFLTNDGSCVSGKQFTGERNQIWNVTEYKPNFGDDENYTYVLIQSEADGKYIVWDDNEFVAKMDSDLTIKNKNVLELYSLYYDFESNKNGWATGYINAVVIAPWAASPSNWYAAAGLNNNRFAIVDYNIEYAAYYGHHSSDDYEKYPDLEYAVVDSLQIFEFIDVSTYQNTKVNTVQNAGVEDFVSRMYTVALNREAETEGLNDWVGQLRNHTIDGAGIANGFINSREFLNKNLSNDDFVRVLYATFFDREPDEAGMQDWLNRLNTGVSRTEVLSGFVNSEEFSNLCDTFGIARGTMRADGTSRYNAGVRNFCQRMYTKALDRSGETTGIEYWANLINTGAATPKDVAKSFFNSEEFLNRNLCDADYVDVLYQTFMGRPSEIEGKIYWIQKLHHGGMTREQVAESFAASQEFSNIMAEYGF